jgi:hypothetical protein
MDRQYNDQKKHGQAIQRPKETGTGNTKTKRNMDVVLSVHVSFGRCIVCPCFFWSLYCLSVFLLVVVLPVHVSCGRCIACPFFFWSSTTKRNLDRQYNYQKKHGQTYNNQKKHARNMDRQYNDQKKHGQTI